MPDSPDTKKMQSVKKQAEKHHDNITGHKRRLMRSDIIRDGNIALHERRMEKYGEIDGEPIIDEIRRILGGFMLPDVLRYRSKEGDLKLKEATDTTESVADHIAMLVYLSHYFLPILEKQSIKLDYNKVLDMCLMNDLPDVAYSHKVGLHKNAEHRRRELEAAAGTVANTLPRRNNFHSDMAVAFREYVGRASAEAKFVRAVNGLASMLYIVSRAPEVRRDMIGGSGYTVEHYDERIGIYCGIDIFGAKESPLYKIYNNIRDFLVEHKYFATGDNRQDVETLTTEEELQIFDDALSKLPLVDNSIFDTPLPAYEENKRLEWFRTFKERIRFGHGDRQTYKHQGDTNAEHVAGLLFYNRYFLPDVQNMNTISSSASDANFDLWVVNEILLGHDHTEIVVGGDVVTFDKGAGDKDDEADAAEDIANFYAPRAGDMDERYRKLVISFEKWKADIGKQTDALYEKNGFVNSDKGKTVMQVLQEVEVIENSLFISRNEYAYATALDKMEARYHLYNLNIERELNSGRLITAYLHTRKQRKFFLPFPTLLAHLDALLERKRRKLHIDGRLDDVL